MLGGAEHTEPRGLILEVVETQDARERLVGVALGGLPRVEKFAPHVREAAHTLAPFGDAHDVVTGVTVDLE